MNAWNTSINISCGNATRASQAYCSNTCRDSDNRSIEELDDDQLLMDALQLSPAVSAGAVPALIPSSINNTKTSKSGGGGTKSGHTSGNTTPHAGTTSRRSSGNGLKGTSNNALTSMTAVDAHTTTRGAGGRNNRDKVDTANTGSSATGSSSSPPTSSATSSPAIRTSADEDHNPHVEEDIEGLLLPPPAVGHTSPNRKTHQQQQQHFDYAYP